MSAANRPSAHSLAPIAPCTSCGEGLALTADALVDYLRNVTSRCGNDRCKHPVDWFDALRKATEFTALGFGAIGAVLTFIHVQLVPNGTIEVNLEEHIGANKRILWISYLAKQVAEGWWVRPLEVHGHIPHRAHPSKFSLFGQAHGTPPEGARGLCDVTVVWTDHSPDDPATTSLVDAFERFHEGDYTAMIIPANVAVEARVGRLLTDFLTKKIGFGKDKVESFLTDGATYAHQLGVLLPLITKMSNVIPLRDRVASGLVDLRRLRNDLAHTGEPRSPVNRERAAELLVAALMGAVYVDYLRSELLGEALPIAEITAATPPDV